MTYENFCHWLHGFFSGVHGSLGIDERQLIVDNLQRAMKEEKEAPTACGEFTTRRPCCGGGSCS